MSQQKLFRGRDKRQKGWFWMDNEYLNGYAKHFGAVGSAIYISLCRHADNETQNCFPAQKKIAEELGIAERTVRNYLNLFEKYHLIEIKREKDEKTKRWENNIYTLLDKKYWKKPEATNSSGKPEANDDKSQRQQMPHKETHIINKTHKATKVANKDINEIIEAFNSVNPSYKKLFKNTTERKASERLILEHGKDRIIQSIKVLPQIISKPYAPKPITPYQFESDLGKIKAFISQSKGAKNKSRIIK